MRFTELSSFSTSGVICSWPAIRWLLRLQVRGDDPTLLHRHQAFADWMRHSAQDPLHLPQVITTDGWHLMRWERLNRLAPDWHVTVLDTTAMSPAEVAAAVVAWCRQTLNGETRTLRVND